MKIGKGINKVLILAVVSVTLLTAAGADLSGGKITLSKEEETTLTALLGDLNEAVPTDVRDDLGNLVHKADTLMKERELKENYQMSDEEYKLWENITALLDKETIRQFGEDSYEETEPDSNLDYGKETMTHLKKSLSKQDWEKLNKLRNEYFIALENDDEEYDLDIDSEIRSIIGNYKELDVDATLLNLLDDKNQKNQAVFCITSDFKAVYQAGAKNGLKSLSIKEQKQLEKNWKVVTDIIPKELFANFKYLKVGGDGEWGTYAYVIPVDEQGKTWCLTVDPADIKNDGLFPYTVVHELCHYLTLNEKQVTYYGDNQEYYPQRMYSDWECVAREESYLQGYYQAFWKDIINDWTTNPENPYFYYRHQSEFVTGYAATECAEDLAESFSAYVLLKSADTPTLQAKFEFFDKYPELRKVKQQILKKIEENDIYVNPEIEPEDENIFKDAA